MAFELLPSLPEALRILSETTSTPWTRDKFFNAVIKHALPLRSTTPNDCWPVIESMGKQYDPDLPILGHRRLALLPFHAIKNLAMHKEAETVQVAFEPGDYEFVSWLKIKEIRVKLKHELDQKPRPMTEREWSEHSATFMGESDVVILSKWVTVTDDTCRVPPETIAELQALSSSGEISPEAQRMSTVPATQHRTRRNSLDAPIEKAIKAAGSIASSDVWVQLRESALRGDPPFTGEIEGSTLHYTNDDNQVKPLTKAALKKRIERLREVGIS